MDSAVGWMIFNLFTVLALAFYSMVEMACVSVNKARLQFYAINGSWRAQLLQKLLNNPSWLFSTTLIGVNVATFVGSECAREFYSSLGLDPDLAPLTQVILVVVIGELAPMFAARKFSEHVALLGAPLLYLSAKILFPITWSIEFLTNFVDKLLGSKSHSHELLMGKDELLKMVEGQEVAPSEGSDSHELNNVASALFNLHTFSAKDLMQPLQPANMLPSDATITQLRNFLRKSPQNYFPIYHRRPNNIVGILHARDVVRAPENHRVSQYAQPPWFITLNTSIGDIIQQFRRNNQRIAFILGEGGKTVGYLTFSALIQHAFGGQRQVKNVKQYKQAFLLHEKTLDGSITVKEFKNRYGISLDEDETLTLEQLIIQEVGQHPNVSDSVIIGPYKLTVKSTTLLGVRTIAISSII
ncbi:MAG: hemolysin family protein [Parachlamydiales bacterium]|jgi:CBS domain containing-hemolysin-like protein